MAEQFDEASTELVASTELALHASEQRFRLTIDSALDAVVTIDQDGRIIEWNPQAERTFGWTRGEAVGQPMADLIVPPEYRGPHQRGLDRFLATGEGPALNRRLELSALRRSGEQFPIELTISPLQMPDGYQFSAFVRDLSESKAIEASLRASEERFRVIVEGLPAAVYTCDAEGKINLFNQAAVELWGREPDLGHDKWCGSWKILTPQGEPLPLDQCPMAVALREGRPIKGAEIVIEHTSGRRVHVSANPEPLFSEAGEVVGAINMLVDITDRKQVERELRENIEQRERAEQAVRQREQFLQRTLDSLFTFVGVLTPDGTLIQANRTALEFARIAEVDVIGKPFAETYWWSHDPAVQQQLREAIARASEGAPSRYDVKVRVAEGRLMTIDFQLVPMRDDGGRITHLIASGMDVSKRTRAEGALRDSEAKSRLLSLVAENSPDFIGVSDTGATPVFINEAALQLVGATREEALATSVAEYFVPEEREYVRKVVLPIVVKEGRWAGELKFRHFRTGAAIPVLYNVFRVDDPETGQPINFATITRDLTQQKQAERRIRESEEFLRRTLDGMIAYTGVCDVDGNLIFANKVGLDAGGVEAGDVLGQPFHTTVWWKHDATVREQILQCLRRAAAGETARLQTNYWHASGQIRNVDFQAAPMCNEAGEIVNVVVSGLDVTDRWRAEQAQRESEELTRLLLASTGEAIYGLDLEGRCTFCNPACVRLLGYENEDALLGQPMHSIIHHSRSDGTAYPVEECRIFQALSGGQNVHVDDEMFWRSDGSSFPAEYWSQPIRRDGEIVGAVVTFLDITERKQAQETRSRLAAIIESSQDAIIGKTLDCLITSWNRGAERLYGYTSDEMIGSSIQKIVPAERYDELDSIITRLERGDKVANFETVRVCSDGRRIDVSLTISPVHDSSGNIVGASAIARDITERKRYEQRLLEADRHKDDFIAMLAHELRNPLAPIRNAAQVFELVDLGDQTLVEMRDIIKRQVSHMARLLDDLLDVSRIARGKVELKREQVDLCELTRTTAEDLRGTFVEQGLELAVQVPDRPLMINADPTRISQCIGNLLHNARKFTPEGGAVQVELSSDNHHATIKVVDNGVGMEDEFIEHLFEPFRQADRSLHRSPGGLGLGLAMVKGLVELHGGSASAASDGPEKGSTFVIQLPRDGN